MKDFSERASKKIQLTITPEDHEALRDLAEQAGVTQGFVLHLCLEMLQMVVGAAVESGVVDDESRISNVEAFVALTLRHMGLLTDDEFDRAIFLADVMEGDMVNLRLRGLATMANERIEQLRPIWEAARLEAKARRAAEWTPQVAALKQAIAAQVGADMVAADSRNEVSVDSPARALEQR